jgi:hypothetical protein
MQAKASNYSRKSVFNRVPIGVDRNPTPNEIHQRNQCLIVLRQGGPTLCVDSHLWGPLGRDILARTRLLGRFHGVHDASTATIVVASRSTYRY